MDENVFGAITKGLRRKQVDVLTVQEDGKSGYPDPMILDRATELERVLFTQDDDFLSEAHRRQLEEQEFSGVIYAHQLDVSIGDCIRDLEMISEVNQPYDLANRVQYLPL
jgi:hypothetical protein